MGYGYEWLTTLEQALRDAGFQVERGYPAKNAVYLIETVAAVNLTRLDIRQRSATVTVAVIAPRKHGLDHCQKMAEKAALALSGAGGQWQFSGWKFDSGISCFMVEVVGTVNFFPGDEGWIADAGYQVLIGGQVQEYVTDFLARQERDRRLIRPHGQAEPTAVTPGMDGWTIRLTQLLPSGQPEPVQPEEPFTMKVTRGGQSQVYSGCCWSDYTSQQCAQGTRVIRSGFALRREVSSDGSNEV